MREDLLRLVHKLNAQNRFIITTDIDEITFPNPIIQVSTYRIVKECVSNSIRHSKGSQLCLKLKQKAHFCEITITDNGLGFDANDLHEKRRNHFGLSMVEERVSLLQGSWVIESSENNGTKITITLPLQE